MGIEKKNLPDLTMKESRFHRHTADTTMSDDPQPKANSTQAIVPGTIKVLDKADVKRVKTLLETQGIYNNQEKIRFDSQLGCFLLPVVFNPNLLSSSDSSNGGSCEQLKIGEEQFQVVVGSSGAGKSSSNGNTTASKTTESTTVPISGGGLRPAVGAILATNNTLSEETRALMTSSISTKYSLYPPLVLFNYGMFGAQGSAGATAWEAYLQEPTRTTQFFAALLEKFFNPRSGAATNNIKKSEKNDENVFTHVAENWPIPDKSDILRLPSRIRLFYPVSTAASGTTSSSSAEGKTSGPKEPNNSEELWCTVTQNGIKQTWAPKHTMFSRGNIKEKARVLNLAKQPTAGLEPGLENTDPEARTMAVDLYAGIGYFTFSYAASQRIRAVLCWELNPWSIEGLVRGARLNKWQPVQVQNLNNPGTELEEELRGLKQYFVLGKNTDSSNSNNGNNNSNNNTINNTSELRPHPNTEDATVTTPLAKSKSKSKKGASSDVNIIVFAEDNIHAFDRVQTILGQQRLDQGLQNPTGVPSAPPLISHINMGLLPHAHLAYPVAIQLALVSGLQTVSLHVHENVAVLDFDAWIEQTTQALQKLVDGNNGQAGKSDGSRSEAQVVFMHLEKIKTYAPGVWHICGDFNVVKGGSN